MKSALIELMNAKGYSQAAVARAINVSGTTLSQYLNDKYPGDVKSLEAEIGRFIDRWSERDRASNLSIPFVMTPTAKKGLELVKLAHELQEINVLYGQAGIGKTVVLKHYAAENGNTALLIEADPGYTAKVLVGELARQLNVTDNGNLHEMIEAVVAKLRGSDTVVLVDEAELLPLRALEVLRRIHDRAGVGVVLAGMPRLLLNLKGKKGEFVQLYSRVALGLNLGNALPRGDITTIARCVIADLDAETEEAFVETAKGNAKR